MMTFNPAIGYEFDAKKDCNGKCGIAGNYKVNYKGDTLTASILWFVDIYGTLLAPAYNDLNKGFSPISSGLIESEDSFDIDMQRFIKSNKPYYGILDSALIVTLKLKFDEEGNLLDDSEFQFYAPKRENYIKQATGSLDVKYVCDRLVTETANPSMSLWQIDDIRYQGYISKIKQQLTKEICQDRLSFLSYLVKDR